MGKRIHIRVPYALIEKYLEFIRRERLDLEIYFNGEALDSMAPDAPARILDSLDYSPSLSIHSPFMDLNPGAVDERVLDVTRERLRQTFKVAETLKPRSIVFHSGYEKWKYDHNVELWVERSMRFWPEFVERAEKIGCLIAVENIFEDEPGGLVALMERIGSERVGICFDAGHCNLFTRVPQSEWVRALGRWIVEYHLHDNKGDFDSHLAMGEGAIDFRSIFAALKDKDIIHTIEALDPESTLKSIKAIRDIYDSL